MSVLDDVYGDSKSASASSKGVLDEVFAGSDKSAAQPSKQTQNSVAPSLKAAPGTQWRGFGPPRYEDAEWLRRDIGAANKGLVSTTLSVASGLTGTLAELSQTGRDMPGGWYPHTPEIAKKQEQFEQSLEAKAQNLFEASQLPRFNLPQDASWHEYASNIVASVLPFAAASTAGMLAGGPAGSFMVASSVEGDNAYRSAMQDLKDRTDLTYEQKQDIANGERVVVGTINGALELLQVGGVMRIVKGKKGKLAQLAARIAKSKLAKNPGAKWTAEQLGEIATESLQEVMQQGTQIGAAIIGHNKEYKPGEIKSQLEQAALGGAVGYVGLGGAGRVLTNISENIPVDYSQYEGEENPAELTSWYEPEPRVMPKADVEDAVSDTAVAQDIADRPKPKPEPEVTPEEQKSLERLESEDVEPEPVEGGEEEGTVAPNLYIGNVTGRAKKAWAEIFEKIRQASASVPLGGKRFDIEGNQLPVGGNGGGGVQPEDVKGHTEGGFPTKRTQIEMSRSEAEQTLADMEETLDEELDRGEWTSEEIAAMKALWGDIREVRQALGREVGQMPFRVQYRGQKPVVAIKSPLERTWAAIKGPSKKMLAKWTPKDLVTQGEALAAGLKKVAQAANKAYRQGAKEAVKTLRRDLRIIRNKQRILKLVRDYRKKLVEQITRPISQAVDPLYAQAIRIMGDAMDRQERTAATRKRLAGLERALKSQPEIAQQMRSQRSLDLLKRLGQVPLENISTEQLQELAQERIRLEREGNLEAVKLRRKRAAESMKQALIDQVKMRKKRTGPNARERRNIGKWRKAVDRVDRGGFGYLLGSMRPDRIMHWLDGQVRGVWTKYVWEPMKRASVEASVRREMKLREYYDFLQRNGIDAAVLMKKQDVVLEDGTVLKLSPFEQIGIAIMGQDEKARSHLVDTPFHQELRQRLEKGEITEQQFLAQWFGVSDTTGRQLSVKRLAELKKQYEAEMSMRENLDLTDADIDKITKAVAQDSQLQTIADYYTQQLDDLWDLLVRVSREVGIDPTGLVKVGKYLQVLTRDVDYTEQDDLLMRTLGQFIPEDFLPERKWLKERTGGKQDIELDAQMLFLHSISEVEQFLSMAPVLSQLSHVIKDKDFSRQLNRVTHGFGTKYLSKWIVDTARGRVVREQNQFSKWIHKLHRHGLIYALGWNIPVVLKQSISTLNALASNQHMIGHYIESIVQNASPRSFDRLMDEVFEKSKLVRERNFEHLLADQWNQPHLRKQVLRATGHRVRGAEMSKLATLFIRKVDIWTVVHSWKAAYETAVADGTKEDAAIRYADQVIQRTQPMARPEDLPHYFRGGVIEQLAVTFTNQINQNFNFWVHDIYGARKAGKISNSDVAYKVLMSYVLPSIVLGILSRGRLPEDPSEVGKDLLLYVGGTPVFFGRILTNILGGWGNSLGLWSRPFEAASQLKTNVEQGNAKGIMKNAALILGTLFLRGAVTAQTVRTTEGAVDLARGGTDDPRRLIWSEWALQQTEESGGKRRGRKRRSRKRRSRRR